MLNVLIAIVSDSYDRSRVRSRKLFLHSRFELAAEFELVSPRKDERSYLSVRVLEFALLAVVMPCALIYGPVYFCTYCTAGSEAAKRYTPVGLLHYATENETEVGNWEGRVLTMARQTNAMMSEKMEPMEARINGKIEQMERTMAQIKSQASEIAETHAKVNKVVELLKDGAGDHLEFREAFDASSRPDVFVY